jgi:hypothetical protein
MFLNSEDMSDDEDVGNSDIVVPLSLVASTPQIINGASRPGNGNRSALEGEDPPGGRSNQYNERLARARALNEQKRKVSTSGMVVANVDNFQRPGAASMASIDVLSQEVEEMELEEAQSHQAAYHQQPQVVQERVMVSEGVQQMYEQPPQQSMQQQSMQQQSYQQPAYQQQQQQGDLRQQQQQSPQRSLSGPAVIDTTDLRAFLMRPGPQGAMVQCYIQRRKTGLGRLFPTYEIYLKDGDQFLLAARKRKKNKSSNYLISLDKDDLARQSGNFFGKLRSNFIGTEFVLYDKGTNPEKLDEAQKESSLIQARQELGTVLYKQNVLGSRGPRKMKVMVPRIDAEGQRRVLKPTSNQESMLERYKVLKDDPDVMCLKNKPPKWNDQVGAYVLNFNGRVTRASVKNFQLSDPKEDPDVVVMQFGRVGKDAFTMDFQYPLCALQAFGIALSSFDYKIACE